MDRLEEQLKNALRRRQPPEGFAPRIVARVGLGTREARRWLWFPRLRWALVLLLCVAVFGGLVYRHARVERARGEVAKRQAIMALRIAGRKIQEAKSKVRHLSEP
jgi:hypothetical protein